MTTRSLALCIVAALVGFACSSSQSQRPAATASTEPPPEQGSYVTPESPDLPGSPATPELQGESPVSSANDPVPAEPIDHSKDERDLRISQQVRESIMAEDNLSFTAKNVEIFTEGGTVTLRGAVKSVEERSAIERCARGVPGVHQVDNQTVVAQ